MILYYRYFHSKGPIEWKSTQENVELNNKAAKDSLETVTKENIRCFKSSQKESFQTDSK